MENYNRRMTQGRLHASKSGTVRPFEWKSGAHVGLPISPQELARLAPRGRHRGGPAALLDAACRRDRRSALRHTQSRLARGRPNLESGFRMPGPIQFPLLDTITRSFMIVKGS